jgi:hypothetical protein
MAIGSQGLGSVGIKPPSEGELTHAKPLDTDWVLCALAVWAVGDVTKVAPSMMPAENAAACHHFHVLARSDHATPAQYTANTPTPDAVEEESSDIAARSLCVHVIRGLARRYLSQEQTAATQLHQRGVVASAWEGLAQLNRRLSQLTMPCPRAACIAASRTDAPLRESRVPGSLSLFSVACAQCDTPLAACDNCCELLALAPREAPPDASYHRCAPPVSCTLFTSNILQPCYPPTPKP